jgi:hypothetical protein
MCCLSQPVHKLLRGESFIQNLLWSQCYKFRLGLMNNLLGLSTSLTLLDESVILHLDGKGQSSGYAYNLFAGGDLCTGHPQQARVRHGPPMAG